MIIDLDSWEIGYQDGHSGRAYECPASRDQVSYSSGFAKAAQLVAKRAERLDCATRYRRWGGFDLFASRTNAP